MSVNDKQVGGNHYRSTLQHWDFVNFNGIHYLEAMVLKYVSRSRKKNGLEDLYKAIHFVEKLIQPEIPFTAATTKEYIDANGLDPDEAAVTALIMRYHEDPSDKGALHMALDKLQTMALRLGEKG